MPKKRLFIGVEVPQEIKGNLAKIQKKLLKNLSLRLTNLKNLHITLHFLGYLGEKEIEKVKEILAKIAKGIPSFNLAVGNFCFFPNERRFRVIALEIDDKGKLCDLQKKLGQELVKLKFIRVEKREYKPHLTIARAGELRLQPKEVELIKKISAPENQWRVSSIKLIKSVLKRSGAEYRVLENWKLKK